VVLDARTDTRFMYCQLVGRQNVHFYAGVPLCIKSNRARPRALGCTRRNAARAAQHGWGRGKLRPDADGLHGAQAQWPAVPRRSAVYFGTAAARGVWRALVLAPPHARVRLRTARPPRARAACVSSGRGTLQAIRTRAHDAAPDVPTPAPCSAPPSPRAGGGSGHDAARGAHSAACDGAARLPLGGRGGGAAHEGEAFSCRVWESRACFGFGFPGFGWWFAVQGSDVCPVTSHRAAQVLRRSVVFSARRVDDNCLRMFAERLRPRVFQVAAQPRPSLPWHHVISVASH